MPNSLLDAKTTIKRPFLIWFAILGYPFLSWFPFILAIVFNVLGLKSVPEIDQMMVESNGFSGFWKTFGLFYQVTGIVFLCTTLIVTYGIYRIKNWAWISFFANSIFLFVICFIKASNAQNNYKYSVLAVTLLGTLAISLIIQQKFRMPFLTALTRGWRISERVPVEIDIEIWLPDETKHVKTRDLSRSGCLINGNEEDFFYGQALNLHLLNHFGKKISLVGEIVRFAFRENSKKFGIGIRFLNLTSVKSQFIKEIIKNKKLYVDEQKEPSNLDVVKTLNL